MANITYPLLFIFALSPSFIWLAFYLRKDANPEPNRMIIKIFLGGALMTIPAILFENFLEGFFSAIISNRTLFLFIYFLVGIALVEETLKYLIVRTTAFRSRALNEPVDVMLYMIIAALGFAAFENILLLFGLIETYSASDIFLVNTIRFVQAVLLHALASGILGFFIALSFYKKNRRGFLTILGLFLATLLHGLFNFYIFTIGDQDFLLLLLPIIPLLAIAIFISFGFKKLKNYKTVHIT